MYKEFVYRISLEDTYTNRRIRGIQFKKKVKESQLKEDLDYKYLYKYNPKEGKVVRSTTYSRRNLGG